MRREKLLLERVQIYNQAEKARNEMGRRRRYLGEIAVSKHAVQVYLSKSSEIGAKLAFYE